MSNNVENYSAMGLIYEYKDSLFLAPLALPTLKKNDSGKYVVPKKYQKMFPDLLFKAYGYSKHTLKNAPDGYVKGKYQTFYAKLKGNYKMNKNFEVSGTGGAEKSGKILLGLWVDGEPISESEFLKLPPNKQDGYFPGLLRTIYSEKRAKEMLNKKHELFIPAGEQIKTFPIDPEALDRFYRLASERKTENDRRINAANPQDPLPFSLKGAQEFKDRKNPYRLQHGDIVFFEPDDTGEKVIKVWVSQLWREEIPYRPHDFFKKELLPFHKDRKTITPAEALFGFVEENPKDPNADKKGGAEHERALAGRIRFSYGDFIGSDAPDCWHDEIPLRILASPKPPCPPFYFRNNRLPQNLAQQVRAKECYIPKRGLNPNDHRPQGRKFYFNHDSKTDIIGSAKTAHENENKNQKNKVTPLKTGTRFFFRVDFDNLSDWELGLLIYSLKPEPRFYHKIGMGKPLGFGSVDITVAAILCVDRQNRYLPESFLNDLRYHRVWTDPKAIEPAAAYLNDHEQSAISENIREKISPDDLKNTFVETMPEPIRRAIEKIGRPDISDIKPPMASDQTDPEKETFKWFVNNDRAKGQGLVPLEYNGKSLPALEVVLSQV